MHWWGRKHLNSHYLRHWIFQKTSSILKCNTCFSTSNQFAIKNTSQAHCFCSYSKNGKNNHSLWFTGTLRIAFAVFCWSKIWKTFLVTSAVAVVIFVPPDAPTTILTLLCLSNIIVGHIEERGLLPCTKRAEKSSMFRHFWRGIWSIIRYISCITLSCTSKQKTCEFFTWLDKVVGWRRNAKAIGNVRRAEVVHLVIKDNASWAWHHFRAKTTKTWKRWQNWCLDSKCRKRFVLPFLIRVYLTRG